MSSIRNLFENYTETENGFIIGETCDVNEMMERLEKLGFSYSKRSSDVKKGRVRFSHRNGYLPVTAKAGSCAFKSVRCVYYDCIHGHVRGNSNYTFKAHENGPNCKKRVRIRGTKKFGCNASMIIHKICRYPGYVLSNPRNKREKRRVLAKLKEDVNPLCEDYFYVKMSLPSHHNHFAISPSESLSPIEEIEISPTSAYVLSFPDEIGRSSECQSKKLLIAIRKFCEAITDSTYDIKENCDEKVLKETAKTLCKLKNDLDDQKKTSDGVTLLKGRDRKRNFGNLACTKHKRLVF